MSSLILSSLNLFFLFSLIPSLSIEWSVLLLIID